MNRFTTLFLDVGGVLLSNGWDHHMRKDAAVAFNLNINETESRHSLTFDTYEIGKISLETYLDRTIFYEPRTFSKQQFKEFMFSQSTAQPNMIKMVQELKKNFGLKAVVISNEGRELMENRIERFKMKDYIDFFVCSGFIGLRKPDEAIYKVALDASQVDPKKVIYLDDRPMLVEIARNIGMEAIHHVTYQETQRQIMNLLKPQ